MLKKIKHSFRKLFYYLYLRPPSLIKGALFCNGIKAYWFRDIVNFGDLITPLLLKHYGFTPIHTLPHKAQLVSTGSILEHLPVSYSGAILGSGFIYEESRMLFPRAQVLSVRGELSRERLGARHKNVTLGDPGLLAFQVMPKRETKKYIMGIIPHHVYVTSSIITCIAEKYPSDVLVIDVREQPMKVFHLIDQCEHILSSSLHGLIVADSLGIPNGWLWADALTGGRFKFDDYYSSLNIQAGEPFELTGSETLDELVAMTTVKPADRILELRNALHELWSNLRQVL